MTEQTVSVPVELLKRIEEEVYYDSLSPLKELRAFIPDPPKVGDVLTADQIRELPDTAVMRDEDGDVLVKARDAVRRVTMERRRFDTITWQGQQINGLANAYTVTLVSLPEESK